MAVIIAHKERQSVVRRPKPVARSPKPGWGRQEHGMPES
jgi:hypothetical protein